MTASVPLTRAILIKLGTGREKIISGIPHNAKITYGPVNPGSKSYTETYALRIYTTANNQLAVYVGVSEFRDLSLTEKVKRVHRSESAGSEDGPKGKRATATRNESYEWEEVPD